MKRTRRVRNKYRPYIRRGNGREKAETFRMANEVARSKHELRRTPMQVTCGHMTFRQWAKLIETMAKNGR